MLKKICSLTVLSLMAISSFLSAVDYEIRDIGTLQTHSSKAIAINNQGQILGWYNIDGSNEGKHFFVRDQDGSFHGVPSKENGVEIDWRYLTNEGKAYGTFDGNANFAVLYGWDQEDGLVNLGDLPGKEIVKINDIGQVLIKSVAEYEGEKSIRRPVIWHNGKITKLRGLKGDLGIESDEAYGYDMNNCGEVVGQSVAYLSYKNNLYKKFHAVKWINGNPLDLHSKVPKTDLDLTIATRINDCGDVLIGEYLVRGDGKTISFDHVSNLAANNYIYGHGYVYDNNKNYITGYGEMYRKILYDNDTIWGSFIGIIHVNDNGEIIAKGKTIYGEEHAMLLVPAKAE